MKWLKQQLQRWKAYRAIKKQRKLVDKLEAALEHAALNKHLNMQEIVK